MTPHTHTATAGSSPRGNASRGASVAASPGTHSLPTRATENPARAPSPAAQVAGAFIPANAKPVTYHGITYPSRAALARALGVSRQHIDAVARQGRWNTLGRGRAVGIAAMHKVHRNACAAHGWEWETQKDAAKAIGVIPQTVCSALNRGRFGDLVLRRLGVKP